MPKAPSPSKLQVPPCPTNRDGPGRRPPQWQPPTPPSISNLGSSEGGRSSTLDIPRLAPPTPPPDSANWDHSSSPGSTSPPPNTRAVEKAVSSPLTQAKPRLDSALHPQASSPRPKMPAKPTMAPHTTPGTPPVASTLTPPGRALGGGGDPLAPQSTGAITLNGLDWTIPHYLLARSAGAVDRPGSTARDVGGQPTRVKPRPNSVSHPQASTPPDQNGSQAHVSPIHRSRDTAGREHPGPQEGPKGGAH